MHAYSCPREDIDYKKVMMQKWKNILDCMIEQGVEVPVLPAIGLNAFLPWENKWKNEYSAKFEEITTIKVEKKKKNSFEGQVERTVPRKS